MAARGVLSAPYLIFPINLDKGASTDAMDVGLARLPATAGSQTWTGGPVKLLCRENLALPSAAVLSDVSFEGSAIIRAGEVDTPIAAGHTRYGTDEMDFDLVRVDDCRTVVCGAQDRAGEDTGCARQLGDRECARTCLLVRMGGVHPACD